jgi:two-component system chemotaxis response regulator CheY
MMSFRALVIDDSRTMRRLISMQLSDLRVEITEADNGAVAWDVLQSMDPVPDVALVDWNMPEMNGIELVRKIRADQRFRGLTIIMVTTESEMTQMAAALAAGANEYVMKPFTKEVLLDKLALMGFGE